jgi:hypothetical protein
MAVGSAHALDVSGLKGAGIFFWATELEPKHEDTKA